RSFRMSVDFPAPLGPVISKIFPGAGIGTIVSSVVGGAGVSPVARRRPNQRATVAARSVVMRIRPVLAIDGGAVISSPTVTGIRERRGRRCFFVVVVVLVEMLM